MSEKKIEEDDEKEEYIDEKKEPLILNQKKTKTKQ